MPEAVHGTSARMRSNGCPSHQRAGSAASAACRTAAIAASSDLRPGMTTVKPDGWWEERREGLDYEIDPSLPEGVRKRLDPFYKQARSNAEKSMADEQRKREQ